jgi:hypothetical protein
MRRQPFIPRKIVGTHFCYSLSRPQGHSAAGRIRSIEKSTNLIGNRTRDLLACNIVPQPTALSGAPYHSSMIEQLSFTGWGPLGASDTIGLLYQPRMMDEYG